jgi:hypothetical protein
LLVVRKNAGLARKFLPSKFPSVNQTPFFEYFFLTSSHGIIKVQAERDINISN